MKKTIGISLLLLALFATTSCSVLTANEPAYIVELGHYVDTAYYIDSIKLCDTADTAIAYIERSNTISVDYTATDSTTGVKWTLRTSIKKMGFGGSCSMSYSGYSVRVRYARFGD
jgi:hypothetical protein